MTEVYIIRHCESASNKVRSFAGRADVDISEKGKLQLENLGEYFKNICLDKIYTSPLIRAKKTADSINLLGNAEIIIDERLIEISLGVLDGKPVDDMSAIQRDNWNNAPHLFYVEGGETMADVSLRAESAIKDIVENNEGKKIAICSHGCFIRNLMRILLKYTPDEIKNVPWCDNTGVNKITFKSIDDYTIDFINDTTHLSPEAAATPVSSWTKEK